MGKVRLSNAIVSKIEGYVGRLGKGCRKPSQRFLRRMVLGMAMSGSVMMSEVARKLYGMGEASFRGLHKGLCRGLVSAGWSALPVQQSYLQQAGLVMPKKRMIACDLGDITKPRARKMPHLATVRDGSTGELRKGWWLIEIEAIFGKGKHLPLWLEIFSVRRRGYKSQRHMVEMAIGSLVASIGKLGLWLFDRGFDNWEFFKFLGDMGLSFLVRVQGKRIVRNVSTGKKRSLGSIAMGLPVVNGLVWGRKGKGYALRVGFCVIEILQSGQQLTLIVVHGFGKNPLLLVTNEPVGSGREAVRLVRCYLKRWGVEEAGRLLKQVFGLENLRVLSWAGLVKLVWIALWTYGFLCLIRLQTKQLFQSLVDSFPSFGPIPRFPYYRIAGAIAQALSLVAWALSAPPRWV